MNNPFNGSSRPGDGSLLVELVFLLVGLNAGPLLSHGREPFGALFERGDCSCIWFHRLPIPKGRSKYIGMNASASEDEIRTSTTESLIQ